MHLVPLVNLAGNPLMVCRMGSGLTLVIGQITDC